jgi:L-fuconolactonase
VASVVVQTVTVPGETPELLELAATSDLIAGVIGWADLTAPGLADQIAELTVGPGGDKLVGLRHQVQNEPDPQWLTRADVLRGLAAVAGAGLAYDLVITAGQLPAAARAAAAVPDLLFVLDHLGKPAIASGRTQPWEPDLRRLAALPNTAGKLSGLVTEADWRQWTPAQIHPYLDVAIDCFGVERLMIGSDWPVCTVAADYCRAMAVVTDYLSSRPPAEIAAVCGDNAQRFWNLAMAIPIGGGL